MFLVNLKRTFPDQKQSSKPPSLTSKWPTPSQTPLWQQISQLLLPPDCTKVYGVFCNKPPWKIHWQFQKACSNNFPRNFHLVTGGSDSFPKGLCASHVKLKDLSTLAEQIKIYSSFQIYYRNIAFHPLPLPYEDWLYHWQDSPTRSMIHHIINKEELR